MKLFSCIVTVCCVALTTVALADVRIGPGDSKTGYESSQYSTASLSIEKRQGQAANLFQFATKQQVGLPHPRHVNELKPNARQIALGRKLFFDRRLSRNQTMSCAMCHIPEQGFSNNELKRPVGFEGRSLKRNAPSLLNVRYQPRLFHDMRESTLAQQAWSPLLAPNEMNNPSVGWVIDQLANDKEYVAHFRRAFNATASMQTVGEALAQYQQSLVAGDSPFDRWFYQQDETALSKLQVAGYELFQGKAGCGVCHIIAKDNAAFTDHLAHNTGVGYQASMQPLASAVTVQLAPGVSTQIDREVIQRVGFEKPNDLGRYEVTLDPDDRWKFRTASLRNIAVTAPYMHNGEFLTLQSVVDFYDQGGVPHEALSPLIKPLNLTALEKNALVAFMQALTSHRLPALISDAFAAEIGDSHSELKQ